VTVTTYSGADRYGTSAAIAEAEYPSGVTSGHVILASGANFPDALAANYLAGQLNAPVLLTPATASDPDFGETTGALAKLLTSTTKDVTIVGGTAAVGPDVMSTLQADGYTVNQIGGATRFDTAEMLDTQSGELAGAGVSGNATAIIATGDNYPDALAAGPLAYAKHFPIILTDGSQSTLSPQAQATLSTDAIKNVLIMGGSAAINPGINTQLTSLGITIDKQFAGADRTDTAGQFLSYVTTTYGFSTADVILASGGNYPDALSAGALGGQKLEGIVLTEPDLTLGTYTTAVLKTLAATANALTVVGGSAAVPSATVSAAQTALESSVTTQTLLPQLVSASIVSTTSSTQANASNAAGTVVQFVFSQALTGAAFGNGAFKVWPSDNGVAGGYSDAIAAGGGICAVTAACAPSTSADSVNVLFGQTALQSTTGVDAASTLTLATVAEAAVSLPSGAINPDGDAGIGAAVTNLPQAGVQFAPNLVSIGTPRAACVPTAVVTSCAAPAPAAGYPNSSAIDLTFDKAAFPQGADPDTADYSLVFAAGVTNAAGIEETCTGPGAADANTSGTGYTVPGYNPATKSITIICANPSGSSSETITTAQIARVVVAKDGVGTEAPSATVTCTSASTPDLCNALMVTPTPHAASGGPDLTAVTLTPGSGTTNPDVAVFTFDTGVTGATVNPADMFIYGQGGAASQITNGAAAGSCNSGNVTAGTCQVSSNPATTQVALYFNNGTFKADATVGGDIEAGAVANNNNATLNGDDAFGAANSAGTSTAPGNILAPQLVSSTVTPSTTVGGTTVTVTWTFSYTIAAVAQAGAPSFPPSAPELTVWDPDGTNLVCAGAPTIGTGAADDTVSCSSFVQNNAGLTPATGEQLATMALATADAGAVSGIAATVPPGAASKPLPAGTVNLGNPEGAVSA
jgi:putative cell wall-binding protein